MRLEGKQSLLPSDATSYIVSSATLQVEEDSLMITTLVAFSKTRNIAAPATTAAQCDSLQPTCKKHLLAPKSKKPDKGLDPEACRSWQLGRRCHHVARCPREPLQRVAELHGEAALTPNGLMSGPKIRQRLR
ncbi:hypothetical protein AV530_002202 [Patagioenas fasciata monilis]|uniref:Uncharacterized protein n=1 Tax=Patagioenas fasciata monilis TaxID=372326 RepID=A0A1V4K5N8_PATFA|nr:hypothetical protein AV530_002202 [Patagioenas fasciata monilis]